ncbi:hypothetical protein B5T_02537 [Alloalcanivorax dieselolei B5]|uniref:SbsA Ig-like domain-containing protein n=1 Tax=Alcanivorax dieselolei (strain DSM 16502 / CGMCC 1.3690 / MCCC 1A00001 / B-5) TaxID=930169 RepID=K0CBA2_ALCDB|nr:Ig-like domain-containing protein [Alloalcanivorax dieselolei]AFT70809.1 hypothetical protein B5T_02537 [Alloalcanivorax dieselolei B5]GGJ97936.1 hypothetical protein GCM10007426_28770 [Alloalcanivorax dieselolei]
MIRGTFNRTLYGTLVATACATVLTACGGSDGSSMPGNDANDAQRQSLLYAYPDDGQAEVPTMAPVVLRFTSDVSLGDVEQSVTLCCDAEGGNLDYTAETVGPDPRGVILTPAQSLSPLTDYTIAIKKLRLRNGTSADRTLRFTTRPLAEGPRSLVVKDEGFAIDRQMPNGDTNEPVMDFSSFRFQFTQPVDRASARYGDTVVLTDSSGDTVEATLLINGHYMTVDPKPEYLTPGQNYTLSLTNGLTSTFDEAFAGTEISFTPADSSPRGEPAMLVQRITQSGLSRLTGKNINQVPVNGTLLGEDVNVTQASADAVVAELADVTEYPDVTPIRLPRGTKLTGSAIEMVMIGGEVPAGFGSGPVDMRLTSDATGYLVPNPYNVHNRADALRIVHLLMDVGIATEDPRANGGFTQDIMHIELVGVAEVDTDAGVLNLDAVGMVEPNILGQEYGYGLLSFQLQSYKDQMNTPTAPEDKTGPTLQSWTLGTDTITGEDKSLLAKPGDPIILNFDEPIDPQSVEGNVTLYKTVNGGAEEEMPAQVYVDGAAIVVKPEEDLVYSPENSETLYRLEINNQVSDTLGNILTTTLEKSFQLPMLVENKEIIIPPSPSGFLDDFMSSPKSPIVLSVYPGFPCALSENDRDLSMNFAGRCAGGFPGIGEGPSPEFPTPGTEIDNKSKDDIIPVIPLPTNHPIIVQFSKNMDTESINKDTFFVEKLNQDGQVQGTVEGQLEATSRQVKFIPEEPWEEGALYRYTLSSSGYTIAEDSTGARKIYAADNYQCGETSICDTEGLPLQTQPIGETSISYIGPTGEQRDYAVLTTATAYTAGGPPMVQFFRGAPKRNTVIQVLSTQPISDVNGNFYHDFSNIGTANGDPNGLGEYLFNVEEYGPSVLADDSNPDFDPGGLKPAPNSSKILSRYASQPENFGAVKGLNFGCSYTGIPFVTPLTPMECPEHKFAYLISGMVAEVTDVVTDQGLEVKIWPSQVLTTSLNLYARTAFPAFDLPIPGFTGVQILRMRFDEDTSSQYRNRPITGWITEQEGKLIMNASLDLYVDAPSVPETGLPPSNDGNTTNVRSYPISMSLTGGISFMDDGRMVVEQYNTEDVDILIRFHNAKNGTGTGYADTFIPAYGSRLNFLSESMK